MPAHRGRNGRAHAAKAVRNNFLTSGGLERLRAPLRVAVASDVVQLPTRPKFRIGSKAAVPRPPSQQRDRPSNRTRRAVRTSPNSVRQTDRIAKPEA
jgi:hypothetical protein